MGISSRSDSGDRARTVGGRWILVPLGIAVLSRVYAVALLLGLARLDATPRPDPLTMWDGEWYLRIARDGYHAGIVDGGHDYAFFPAWPMLIRAATTLGVAPETAAVLLANVLFVVAAVLVWRALAPRFGDGVATGATALLAFAPPAHVFSLAYSESLFLCLAALHFVLAGRSLWRGPVAALASLTRVTGLAIVASAAHQFVTGPRSLRRGALAAIVGGLVGFAAWWVFIAWLTGDPLGYLGGSSAWVHGDPAYNLVRFIGRWPIRSAAWAAFVGALIVGTVLAWRRDRELAIYAAGALAIAMIPLVAGGMLHSVPRYAVLAFPAVAGLADRLGRRGTLALLLVFAIGEVFFVRWAVAAAGAQSP